MKYSRLSRLSIMGVVLIMANLSAAEFTAFPDSGKSIMVLKESKLYIGVSFEGWGARWKYVGFGRNQAIARENGSLLTASDQIGGTKAKVSFKSKAGLSGNNKFTFEIDLSTTSDVAVTLMILGLKVDDIDFTGGEALFTCADGKTQTCKYPFGRAVNVSGATGLTLTDGKGRKTVYSFTPALNVVSDGVLRIVLAEKQMKAASPVKQVMTMTLPGAVTYYQSKEKVPQAPGFADWYTFRTGDDHDKPSAFGMHDWLEKPAGRHGRIEMKGDRLYYNSKETKLWGVNVCYASCAPDKELADKRAALYAKYGINSVRFHKYADGTGWAGIQSPGSFVEFDPKMLDRMDYFVAQLKKRGIYVKLSSTFTVKLGPEDRKHVPYIDEFGKFRNRKKGRIETKHGSIFLSKEIQDLQIEQVVRLLKHKNPYTGLTYGEDPAIAVVEMFNEDDALYFGTMGQLKRPTLRKRAGILFTDWLQKKYGSEKAVVEAWGDKAINSFAYEKLTGEKWDEKGILPIGNPWYFDAAQLSGTQKFRKQRLLDTMLFLYELQNRFYTRYLQAIRDAGYTGITLASNWQAGSGASHYYNLHTDYQFGLIDRHNYFGGGRGNTIKPVSMLRTPGSGIFSTGMQQVVDKPFMLSEWIHVTPNEWSVEGPAIIGAYAMGLQGWDVSYMFQNRDEGKIRDHFRDQWQFDKPTVIGIFPAVARQVLRMDVKESDLIIPRYVHIPSLKEGKVGFVDKVTQQHDVKTFDSDKVPGEALAVGRCVVEFTDTYRDTPQFDISSHIQGDTVVSSTKQLAWHRGKNITDGFFTVNTDGTKAVVGFAQNQKCVLGDVTVKSASRFGAIYLTAAEKDASIKSSKRLLITAMARVRQTGMKVMADSFILERGKAPFVMEPVRVEIGLKKAGTPTIYLLDHDGVRTEKTIALEGGKLVIDTARDKTPYYEVVY